MKGGVGKTTLAVNLAYALAMVRQKKVLLIDTDPQFNASQYLISQKQYVEMMGEDADPRHLTIADIFRPPEKSKPSIVHSEGYKSNLPPVTLDNLKVEIWSNSKGKLDLIPSTLELIAMDYSSRGTENRLRKFLHKIRGAYDLFLIDCPPTLSIFTLSAYLATDATLIPVKPDWLSTIGLPLLERALKQYDSDFDEIYDLDVKSLGIVFSMVDTRLNLTKSMMERISKTYDTFPQCIRQSTHIAEAVAENKPFFLYKKAEPHWKEILDICDELLKRLKRYDN